MQVNRRSTEEEEDSEQASELSQIDKGRQAENN